MCRKILQTKSKYSQVRQSSTLFFDRKIRTSVYVRLRTSIFEHHHSCCSCGGLEIEKYPPNRTRVQSVLEQEAKKKLLVLRKSLSDAVRFVARRFLPNDTSRNIYIIYFSLVCVIKSTKQDTSFLKASIFHRQSKREITRCREEHALQ